MLQLLQPIWLYAMSGIIVPVLIHLWNIRPGKTRLVGSIALLREEGRQQSRRLRLSDWLLLLLRCLLIIALALLLARPVWKQQPRATAENWVLLEREYAAETYGRFQPMIDSLLANNYYLRYFSPDFKKMEVSDASATSRKDSAVSYWNLLATLQQQREKGQSVFIFTINHLRHFSGERPVIDTGIHWLTYTPKDSVSSWQAAAYATANNSIRTRQVTSGPGGTTYTFEESAVPQQADTATLQVTIFTDVYPQDAYYLKAAINAIQQYSQRRMRINTIRQLDQLPAKTNWLYWLSAQPRPANIKADHIWQYGKGKTVNTATHLLADGIAPIPVYKYTITDTAIGESIWQDGFGQPLLYRQQQGNTIIYTCCTRLDPAWNELPWSTAFPGLLLQLLFPVNDIAINDKRAIAATQLQPEIFQPIHYKKLAAVNKDLSQLFWWLVVALFFAERIAAWIIYKPKQLNA